MRARHLRVALAAIAAVGAGSAGLPACGGKGGVGGAGGPAWQAGAGTGSSTSSLAGGTTTAGPAPAAPAAPSTAPVVPSTAAPGPAVPGTGAPAGRLRLGGDDLGLTRVGAPFREAVAAVTTELGRPSGDPPPDTACIGAEEEAAWGAFRLASTGGRVSGWFSTSSSLATPAGVTAGTDLAELRRAYGDRLQVRPPPEPDGRPVFVVTATRLGGTLTGQAPGDTVASLFNGTCESA